MTQGPLWEKWLISLSVLLTMGTNWRTATNIIFPLFGMNTEATTVVVKGAFILYYLHVAWWETGNFIVRQRMTWTLTMKQGRGEPQIYSWSPGEHNMVIKKSRFFTFANTRHYHYHTRAWKSNWSCPSKIKNEVRADWCSKNNVSSVWHQFQFRTHTWRRLISSSVTQAAFDGRMLVCRTSLISQL